MAAAMALVLAPEQRHPSQLPPTTARHLWHGYIIGQGCRREKVGVTVYCVRVFLVLMARRSGCLHHHLEHIQLLSCLSFGAAAVSGTQTHWGLWMTVNSPFFSYMEKVLQMVASFHETQSKSKNKRGLPDYLWVLQRALEERSGRTERSNGAQGRIIHQRPENRGALEKPTQG